MSKKPPWFEEVRALCRAADIEIAGWGPESLLLVAKTPERRRQLIEQFSSMGFQELQSSQDEYAGLLQLMRNPGS
jgi:hypothetical protein